MEKSSSRRRRLVREIAYELDQLQRVAQTAAELSALSEQERRPWDAAAAAKYVADLYLGFENLCKRRYRYLGISAPSGPDSHGEMLNDFLGDPALGGSLDDAVVTRLKKYLRFRHRFSHGYGYEVNWEVVEEPLRLIPETVDLLARIWQRWIARLPAENNP